MGYQEFIQNIIETRGQFGIPDDEYKERHHIKPKCLGGSNAKENMIDLYAREHYIAHKLLAEENPHNSKLQYAWWCMTVMKNEYEERYVCSPEEFEEARIAMAKAMSTDKLGENNPMYGVHLVASQETKDLLSANQTGENNSFYGKHHSEETKQKFSEMRTGAKNPRSRPVRCVETGEVFWGAKEVEEKTGIPRQSVSKVCSGKRNKTGGYHWEYVA